MQNSNKKIILLFCYKITSVCSRELKSNYSTEFFNHSNTVSWIVEYLAEYTTIRLLINYYNQLYN